MIYRSKTPDPPRRIAVFCLSGLGNILLFTPALQALARRYPDGRIWFLTIRKANYELMRHCPLVDTVHLVQHRYNAPADNLRVLGQVLRHRGIRFDLSMPVFPSNRPQYNVVSSLLGARRRLAFRYPSRKRWDGAFVNNLFVDVDSTLHDVEQNFRAASALGVDPSAVNDFSPVFWSTDRHRARAAEIARTFRGPENRPIVAYHPVCFPDMTYKRWPPRHFAALIDSVGRDTCAVQVLLGAPADEAVLASIAEMARTPVRILCDEELLTVGELLRQASLMVSNDSGLMHLAAAAGAPTVGLFGPTMASRTRPWGDKTFVVTSPHAGLPCRRYPFGPETTDDCCGGKQCMEALSTDAVFEFLRDRDLLPKRPLRSPRPAEGCTTP